MAPGTDRWRDSYDAWKLRSPDDERDDEPEDEWEPEFLPVDCDDLEPLVPVDDGP
jgi:hypothetical protein